MKKPDSIRYTREAKQCGLAAKIATFLESYVPPSYYDFVLPDLLHFTNEEALLELRENSVWQALEREFKANGGLVSEFWDEAEEITPPRTNKQTPVNTAAGLVIATIISSALIGGLFGWFFPYSTFQPPQVTRTTK